MSSFQSFANQLLIAMPHMDDPYFRYTVTYICEHTPKGAVGFVLNKPLSVTLGDVFSEMQIKYSKRSSTLADMPILAGGPAEQQKGFVLHEPNGEWFSSLTAGNQLMITTSRDILEAVAKRKTPGRMLLSLGYAGWGPGQLEKEMSDNLWLNAPANLSVIFDAPFADRWDLATRTLGFEPQQLCLQAGHA